MRDGVVLSEIAPDTPLRSWMFAARNRVIAALAQITVVVQASEASGSLLTVAAARRLDRRVGAVPGPVTSALSAGPNQLLAEGAMVVRGPQDLLDALFGHGVRAAMVDSRPPATPDQAALLNAIAAGCDTPAALVAAGAAGDDCLRQLAALELSGRLRRGPGGALSVIP
jgi:DNA processing protein